MTVFGNYAHYYDLIYRDKDYEGEATYVDGLIRGHSSGARTLLELGCGTGRHAELLAQKGYEVVGLDLSDEMLKMANEKACAGATFMKGDIRQFSLGSQFDVAIALFHVVSYQVTNEGLLSTFKCVREHLKPGGLFRFRLLVWSGSPFREAGSSKCGL